MQSRSARLLFAFVLLSKNSISWQYPTAQTQRRPSRDVIFPQDPILIGSRVAGGEDSISPSGVASIIDSSHQRTQARPPIVVLAKVNPTPTREEVLWREIASLRDRNRNSPQPATGNRTPVTASQTRGIPVVPNPTQIRTGGIPFNQARPGGLPPTQAVDDILIYDQNLKETFDRCGDTLERCLSNNPGHTNGHHHSHHSPASNRRPIGHSPGGLPINASGSLLNQNHHQQQHNPSPVFATFNGQRIPVWSD